jgi:hypothetical protein
MHSELLTEGNEGNEEGDLVPKSPLLPLFAPVQNEFKIQIQQKAAKSAKKRSFSSCFSW